MKTSTRTLAAGILAAGLVIAAPLAASAHVTATPQGDPAAGGYGLVTFAFSHGCKESPTTAISIDMPAGLDSVTPTVTPGWQVKVTRANGDGLVQNVTYTADQPVQTGLRVAFDLSVKYSKDAAGKTLSFPVVQSCVQGETDWTQIPADGQDPESLDTPAPSVKVGAAVADSGDDDGDGDGDHNAHAMAAPAADGTGTGTTGVWLGAGGLAAGLAGLVTGIVALRRARR
ncbi:YcnI family protein [Microbacterium sp. SORGH_AS_0888]|uniref:YcnI family copper-binding membrane protein n=1 Tax=Microbacterium sp. SORGH_AS_0888 TaxID=3041791 RepID=UPI002782999A|nr:YcnI family protein [Microbacterium sp. SORGH_AS_0888]MDQ1128017.1 uncharacterized protein YcnI [Microbacterium sp. SORGH_AS_0888]